MTRLIVTKLDGSVQEIDAKPGFSLMEVLRAEGNDDLLAICGGMMSCSTCHVYIDATDKTGISIQSDEERELLEMSEHMKPTSRLSCQIPIPEDLKELHVEIAPED